ncbi:MAG TPA: hypothetical protein VI033_01315 [Candidatus Nitrosopolaris sp.]
MSYIISRAYIPPVQKDMQIRYNVVVMAIITRRVIEIKHAINNFAVQVIEAAVYN